MPALTTRLWILSFVAFFGVTAEGWGQQVAPSRIAKGRTVAAGKPSKLDLLQKSSFACSDDAGDIAALTNISISNNSLGAVAPGGSIPFRNDLDTIFLCEDDAFTIDFDEGSESVVEGDRNPNTQPGIVYGAYGCQPTVEGPEREDIDADPCNTLVGADPFDSGNLAYYVPGGFRSGNYSARISNSFGASLNQYFTDADGERVPIVITLAPVTADALNEFNQPVFETGPDPDTGEQNGCLDVSIDQTLTVAFLTPLRPVNVFTSTNDCSGGFTVRGGVSELRGTAEYNISVTNAATGEAAILDRAADSYLSGETVNYTVPAGGSYLIEISDGMGCSSSQIVYHEPSACAAVCTNNAGEINGFVDIDMQSSSLSGNSVPFSQRPDTIFLCRGDEFTIDHNEPSAVLTYDPDPSTTPGVGYGVYSDIPTISGTSLNDLDNDPSTDFDGIAPFSGDGYIIFGPEDFEGGNYDLRFENIETPYINQFFPGPDGEPSPTVVTVAPVSFTGTRGSIFVSESEPPAQPECLNARIDQWVRVASLNSIEARNAQASSTDCSGSFTLRGGAPELDGNYRYTIDITGEGGQVATLGGEDFEHGDVVNYSVPEPGTYTIEISDGIGCSAVETVVHTVACEPPVCEDDAGNLVGFDASNITGSNVFAGAGNFVPYANYNPADTIWLCFGDELLVDYEEGSENLSGDPDPSTPSGIVYFAYGCAPTVEGTTTEEILNDPCLLGGDGQPNPEQIGFVAPNNYDNGDYGRTFSNNTPTAPLILTLAPATADAYDGEEASQEGGTADNPQCINVSIDQAFTFGYLRPIGSENATQSDTECTGSFEIFGGISEARGTSEYTITVESTTGGAPGQVVAPGSYTHGDLVSYTVPEPGTYLITIEDGIGCGFSFEATHTAACEPAACANDAGNIAGFDGSRLTNNSLGGLDFVPYGDYTLGADTIWLCAGDALGVDYEEGSAVLDSPDPDPSTTPGITYFFYEGGLPTATGPTIDDIINDPNFLEIDPNPFSDPRRYSINPNEFNGQYGIDLDASLPLLNVPLPVPLIFTMAPGTANGFDQDALSPIAIFEGEGDERCVNVSTEQAFTFGVLTPVEANNSVQSPNSCDGSFEVSGGVSQARGTSEYTITVESTTGGAPGQVANPGSYGHGDVVSYTVPDPGTYLITIEDGIGCGFSFEATHTATCEVDAPQLAATSITTDVECAGDATGAVELTISGGTAPYTITSVRTLPAPPVNGATINVDTDGGTASFTDLVAGTYEFTITDAVDTDLIVTQEVEETSSFGVSVRVEQRPLCNGDANGIIIAEISENASPVEDPIAEGYNFEWSDGTTGTNTLSGLVDGTYSVTVTKDGSACVRTGSATLDEPNVLEIAEIDVVPVGCPNEAGSAIPQVTGGTTPYTYRFRNDSLTMPNDTLMPFDTTLMMGMDSLGGLEADTNYVLIVTDANGCVDSLDFDVFSQPTAQIEPIATDFVSCPSSTDGQLTASATPPAGETIAGYIWYALNPDGTLGDVVANGATTDADLPVGFYVVEVTLSNECTAQALGEVASPGLVQLDSFFVEDPVCLGDANGSITVFPSGGTGPYNYEWRDTNATLLSQTQPGVLTQLTAGVYTLTITDANNCQPAFDTTFTLEEPIGIIGEFLITDVSCPDDDTADGAATFNAELSDGSGGTFDFDFSTGETFTGQSSATVTGLTRGDITVTVTDGLCPQIFTDTIGSPEEFSFEAVTDDADCSGASTGSVTVNVDGGTPAYTFDWVDRPEMTNTLDSVGAGIYRLVVTDASGCVSDTFNTLVAEPNPLVITIDEIETTPLVTCNGDSNGVLAVTVDVTGTNPLGDNPYSWSDDIADSDERRADRLAPGTYTVTVTDVEGCQDSLTYVIGEPRPITFAVEDIPEPLCFGETTNIVIDTAFGGQGTDINDYTFTLNNDGFLIPADQPANTFAGPVTVTVFDSVGCSAEQDFVIDEPEEITIDLPERIRIELGDTITPLDPLISPTDGQYEFQWTPADGLSSDSIRNPVLRLTDDRNFTLTVTNQDSCQAIADVLVQVDANRNVYIPNVFSPNFDGQNEDLRVFACRGVTNIASVRIYNRWGGLIVEEEDVPVNCLDGTVIWDGETAGEEAVGSGVYVYVIEVEFFDEEKLVYRGDVTLVR